MMTLCTQDSHCIFDPKTNIPQNFLVTIKPRLLCLTNAFPEQSQISKLLDFCFIQSPASKLLSTSDYLLVTLHQTQDRSSLRLWSKEDGRCIMTSPKELFHQMKIIRVFNLDDKIFSGLLLCLSDDGFLIVFNAFTMTLVKKIFCGFNGLH